MAERISRRQMDDWDKEYEDYMTDLIQKDLERHIREAENEDQRSD